MNGSDVVNFAANTEWNCGDGNSALTTRFPKQLALQWGDFPGQTAFTWYGIANEESQLTNTTDFKSSNHVTSCDQVANSNNDPLVALVDVAMPVGVSFLAASCAAVVIGFAVGSVTAPNGMTIKKREPLAKGCIPKYNLDLANSILATCVLDVALVTVFGVIGVLYPISLLVFASGVLLVVMTYQIQYASKRFGNIHKRAHQLLTVQKVFGRIAGAFLIVTGLIIFIIALALLVSGPLILLTVFLGAYLGWILLGVYITWALVIVHFAAAIYVCVCFYYTAVRTTGQESMRVHHTAENDESSSDYVA